MTGLSVHQNVNVSGYVCASAILERHGKVALCDCPHILHSQNVWNIDVWWNM